MSRISVIVGSIAAATIVNIVYALLVAPFLDSRLPGAGLAGIPWLLAFSIAFVYGVASFRFTQEEFGVKELLRLLAHLTLGWLRHWRLVAAVALISAGLVLVGMSPRFWSYSEVTGYRYVLHKDYVDVIGWIGASSETRQVVTDVNLINMVVHKAWITYLTGISYSLTTVLADAQLIEFPVRTYFQLWYLDMGLVIAGLALIVAGLLFGTYHAIISNNRQLEVCGEHTAKYYANYLKMCGYEVPEGYEEALAEFYKTGKVESLRKFTD